LQNRVCTKNLLRIKRCSVVCEQTHFLRMSRSSFINVMGVANLLMSPVYIISLIIMGKPPALPGDSQSLTFPGISTSNQIYKKEAVTIEVMKLW